MSDGNSNRNNTCVTTGHNPGREKNIYIIIGIILHIALFILLIMTLVMNRYTTTEKIGYTAIFIVSTGLWIWWIVSLSRSVGKNECENCTSDECAHGLYCGGDSKCHKGDHGKDKGAECFINADCEIGLICKILDELVDPQMRCEPI